MAHFHCYTFTPHLKVSIFETPCWFLFTSEHDTVSSLSFFYSYWNWIHLFMIAIVFSFHFRLQLVLASLTARHTEQVFLMMLRRPIPTVMVSLTPRTGMTITMVCLMTLTTTMTMMEFRMMTTSLVSRPSFISSLAFNLRLTPPSLDRNSVFQVFLISKQVAKSSIFGLTELFGKIR